METCSMYCLVCKGHSLNTVFLRFIYVFISSLLSSIPFMDVSCFVLTQVDINKAAIHVHLCTKLSFSPWIIPQIDISWS